MEKQRRHSPKRDAILACIQGTTCHPTAEWVYEQLHPRIPGLSLGTVYRNLAQFREDGSVITVGNVDGHERYDANLTPHSHFICRNCGAVCDLPAQQVTAPDSGEIGIVEACSVTFYGRCEQCNHQLEESL